MNNLLEVPINLVTALTPEYAIVVLRAIFRAECAYAKLSPAALTISSRITVTDGGIDAEIVAPAEHTIPADCIFKQGTTGFQIKSGTSFKPWTKASIRKELINKKGDLYPEVERLISQRSYYTVLCTGHDLTSEQRNKACQQIADTLEEKGHKNYKNLIDVFGASQIAEFAERYPGTASLLAVDTIQEALVFEEWQRDDHMANTFEVSQEQTEIISQIQAGIRGTLKHIRILGEPGLGKTRIVLEAVKVSDIAPYVLYIQNGSQFGQTRLFRKLLKKRYEKPLVLVIDELPEAELSDIWRHLKPRCGSLKIISLDHGTDETHDEEIVRLYASRLADETIRKILADQVGESHELDRWVTICEGSPRVSQAVADNLRANPDDLLKSPSTVPIWARFLHGYGRRDDVSARQIDCVTQHLALFSRFGYEDPIADEAIYICSLIQKVDPTIGWAQFQEIIQSLRSRRVLQGSKTLFFVPKALHIYLWKQFWSRYGRAFDFTQTFLDMPESLHIWFMNMFKFAEDSTTAHVIEDILRIEGIFSQRDALTSDKGSRFLSILAEANPTAVLKLLEATIGKWSDQELLDFDQNRQNLVWSLEKIAVWPSLTLRAIQVLARLSINESSNYSNNSTGTLVGLFRIGPEAAATESTPEARLPGVLRLLRASEDKERRLGLKAISTALDTRESGFRTIGPEFQGLKGRAKLWTPKTYGDWWQAYLVYFHALIDETEKWPDSFRAEVCQALLDAVEHQIRTPPCTELAFQVLNTLLNDSEMSPESLNRFFWHWREYGSDGNHSEIAKKLRQIERRYITKNIESRFQRYVLDVNWQEWQEENQIRSRPRYRARALVNALARRISRAPEGLSKILHLLAPQKHSPALWYFGEQIALDDSARALLPNLIQMTLETKHHVCLSGYLSGVEQNDAMLFFSTINCLLDKENTAWLGATIALYSDYREELFDKCLIALKMKWIAPSLFLALRFGKAIDAVPEKRKSRLFNLVYEYDTQESRTLLIELLDLISLDDSSPVNSDFVFSVVSQTIPTDQNSNTMQGFHWSRVSLKLLSWNISHALPLLDTLLTKMRHHYRLSYDSSVAPVADFIVKNNPSGAWCIIKKHFGEALPKWRSDIFQWLKGGLTSPEDKDSRGIIASLPIEEIIDWIEEDPEPRAEMIAHAAPRTLDDAEGGELTRKLLHQYSQFAGVRNGISATFHSGGWSGPTSSYLKRKREKFRYWLAVGFEIEVVQWIEHEIECLDREIAREEMQEERSRFD